MFAAASNSTGLVLTLPANFLYVGLVGVGTFWLNIFQASMVSKLRKSANIQYPQHMAELSQVKTNKKALQYNCAQSLMCLALSAHANTLENAPTFLVCLFWTGLFAPVLSASMGAVYLFGRVLYTLGYTTGDPSARNTRGGIIAALAYYPLALVATYYAVKPLIA